MEGSIAAVWGTLDLQYGPWLRSLKRVHRRWAFPLGLAETVGVKRRGGPPCPEHHDVTRVLDSRVIKVKRRGIYRTPLRRAFPVA